MARATTIETENEFVEIGLQVFLAQTVVDAERPGLQVGEDAVDPRRNSEHQEDEQQQADQATTTSKASRPSCRRIVKAPRKLEISLARSPGYYNRGRLKGKTLEEITSSGNCTTLIMAAIIYWQAKEISRIVICLGMPAGLVEKVGIVLPDPLLIRRLRVGMFRHFVRSQWRYSVLLYGRPRGWCYRP